MQIRQRAPCGVLSFKFVGFKLQKKKVLSPNNLLPLLSIPLILKILLIDSLRSPIGLPAAIVLRFGSVQILLSLLQILSSCLIEFVSSKLVRKSLQFFGLFSVSCERRVLSFQFEVGVLKTVLSPKFC
jgi:hypothetical protein